MSSGRSASLLWNAEPHTLAKLAILKRYLGAWFQIFGRSQPGSDLLYVDGFAGPGEYLNHSEGSPIAATNTALSVMEQAGDAWLARNIHFAFIERESAVASQLRSNLQRFEGIPRIFMHVLNTTFEDGIRDLRATMPWAFSDSHALFAFIDPFGPTGAPFDIVRTILASSRSEVLINFDADGLERIIRAGAASNADQILDRAFGDGSWRSIRAEQGSFRDAVMRLVLHYQGRLRMLRNVRYAFKFEMLTSSKRVGGVGYFLVFASQHPLGLTKMKEAMRALDQTGEYQFSNALVGPQLLLRIDNTKEFAELLYRRFLGSACVPFSQITDFALNETPYFNPKSMLQLIEETGRIEVVSSDPKRRRKTFNEKNIMCIRFSPGGDHG